MEKMNIKDFVAKIFFSLFIIFTIQFLYFGITTTPEILNESDSLIYHIPIAKGFSEGNFIPPKILQGLGFYPSASELILAVFILLRIPLNTFGILAFVLLFYFAKKTAETFGLSKETSIIYAGSIVTLQSVLRWPLNQTVDIWLAVFFLASLYLFKRPAQEDKYFLSLGIANGFLIGTKYSGLPFLLILILIFGGELFHKINFRKLLIYLIPVLVFGLSWYFRNTLLTGNPLYPANFFFLQGDPEFSRVDSASWSVLGNIFKHPAFLLKFFEALIGEFLVWCFTFFVAIYVLWKRNFSKEVFKLSLVGMLTFLIFLIFLPASPIVSNLRYIYPSIFVLVLSTFLMFKRKLELLFALCFISAIFSVINLSYHPKILVLSFIPTFYFVFLKSKFFEKVKSI